jgi:hypothetical protein
MIIGAVRYAMGRMTYVVRETCEWLTDNWARLPESVTSVIERDLEDEFRRDDRARKYLSGDPTLGQHVYPLGWDCDRLEWERVRSVYRPNWKEEVCRG